MYEFGHFVTHFSSYCPQYARKKLHHTVKQLLFVTTQIQYNSDATVSVLSFGLCEGWKNLKSSYLHYLETVLESEFVNVLVRYVSIFSVAVIYKDGYIYIGLQKNKKHVIYNKIDYRSTLGYSKINKSKQIISDNLASCNV